MKGIIRWFAENGVAANLVMILIIAGGLVSVFTIKQEVFPEFSADIVTVGCPTRAPPPKRSRRAW